MRLLAIFILLMLYVPLAAADISYPTNPQWSKHVLLVSHQGITAYDTQTLQPRWSALATLQTNEPTWVDNKLLVGSSLGLYALDVETGETLWHFSNGAHLFSPSVKDGIAYVASINGTLYALVADSGQLIWQKRISNGWIYPPAIIGNRLISGGQDGAIQAIDMANGELHWRYDVGQELVFRPVATHSGSVIVTTFAGKVFAIDGLSGQLRWQQQHSVASFSPVVSQGLIYLSGYDNQLRVLESDKGELLWHRALPGRPSNTPQIDSTRILFLTQEGRYLLLNKSTGQPLTQGNINTTTPGALLLENQPPLFFSQHGNTPTTSPLLLHSNNT